MQRKQNNFAKNLNNVIFCVRPLLELEPLAALDANDIRHHHSGTDMAIFLLHLTTFFQGEDKRMVRGENHYTDLQTPQRKNGDSVTTFRETGLVIQGI